MKLLACLALVLTVVSAACQGPTATASPPAAPITVPSTVPSAVPSAVPSPSAVAAVELTRTTDALAAGRYTLTAFLPRITLEVEGGSWHAVNLTGSFFDIEDAPGSPDVVAVQFARPQGVFGAGPTAAVPRTAAAAVDVLRGNSQIVVIETSESRIGGLVGSQVTIENPASGSGTAAVLQLPAGALGFDPGRRLWIAFFDTDHGLLAIILGGTVGGWDAALAHAEPVLASVTIGA